MMRSLYSAVSGLKTHQTRMDVIGNNISNVNTEAFKSSQVRFSEIMYQTTASASAGNGATGVGGVNAKQIGLGVNTASTMCNITGAGAAETTGNPFDLRLSDSQTTNFFIVSDGTNTFFTRAGSFYVDGNGYMCMSSTGYTIQGWQVDQTTGEIRKDEVSPLQVMAPQNLTSSPEGTTQSYVSGVLDRNDPNVNSEDGYVVTLGFYDNLGYSYTAKFSVVPNYNTEGDPNSGAIKGSYHISLRDIVDSTGRSIVPQGTMPDPNNANQTIPAVDADGNPVPDAEVLQRIFGTTGNDGQAGYDIRYDPTSGTFASIETDRTGRPVNNAVPALDLNSKTQVLRLSELPAPPPIEGGNVTNGVIANTGTNFMDITMDFSKTMNYDNGTVSTFKALKGTSDGDGAGKKLGAMTGVSIDQEGKVYGTYDNGNTVLLCQIPVAQFANASGLEKVGNNCYKTTLNSGEFNGIGVEVNADGSRINSGELEMSNVDLSGQFTDMIVTQRGFQANSRVITTSDTLLEELINLKR